MCAGATKLILFPLRERKENNGAPISLDSASKATFALLVQPIELTNLAGPYTFSTCATNGKKKGGKTSSREKELKSRGGKKQG